MSTTTTTTTTTISVETLAENVERSIYNSCIVKADEKNIIKKWENPTFVMLYVEKWRTVSWNMDHSSSCPTLCARILSGDLPARRVGFVSPQEMAPELWRPLVEEKRKKDHALTNFTIEASTDKYRCPKCKSRRCTYEQIQTRSADESMTIFITCLDCDKRWHV